MIEEAAALFALAPAEFVAERNRLAKLLKSAGRLDDAQFVTGLKRPKLSEYALNRLAHEHGPIIERLVEAIAAAEAAQSAAIGGNAGGLREATTELRAATKSAVDSAVQLLTGHGSSGEGQRDEITSLIRDFVGSADTGTLRAGVVGSSAVTAGGDLFRGAPDPPVRPRSAAVVRDKAVKKLPVAPPVGPSPADRARKIQLERQLRDAVAGVERAERAVAEAAEQVRQAQHKMDDRTDVLDARRVLAKNAEQELEAFRLEWPSG